MREIAARWVAVLIGILVVGLAAAFAHRENAQAAAPVPAETRAVPPPDEPVDPDVLRHGELVFEDAGCRRCHALEGSGNPRSPLDGVGASLTHDEIRAHIVAAPSARSDLSRSVIRSKEGFAGLPADDLEAVTAFLTTKRER